MNSVDSGSNSALQAAMSGYQAASENVTKAAGQLANGEASSQPNTLNTASVEITASTLQAAASAEVLENAAKRDSTIGSLIDIYA